MSATAFLPLLHSGVAIRGLGAPNHVDILHSSPLGVWVCLPYTVRPHVSSGWLTVGNGWDDGLSEDGDRVWCVPLNECLAFYTDAEMRMHRGGK